jgi:hypothetical protein
MGNYTLHWKERGDGKWLKSVVAFRTIKRAREHAAICGMRKINIRKKH